MISIPDVTFQKQSNPQLEFEIFPLQYLFGRPPCLAQRIEHPHRVNFFVILFMTQGKGEHFIDFQSYPYEPGSIFFISKGQVHSFEIDIANDGVMIFFTEAFLQKHIIQSDSFSFYRLYNYHVYSPVIQPGDMGGADFFNIINEIRQEYSNTGDKIKEPMLASLLKVLLLKAERIKAAEAQSFNSPGYHTFLLFKHALDTHYIKTRDAQEYADMLHISYKQLNSICKEFTSLTAKQFIVQWFILEIKRQLASSELSVKEIAYQSGFDEPTNLVKFFKQRTGQTPAQFRLAA